MMTELVQRASGLVVPKRPPSRRPRGPLEITDDECRERAKRALGELWHAMGLRGGTLEPPGAWDARYRLFRYVGESLLGEDCGDFEVLT